MGDSLSLGIIRILVLLWTIGFRTLVSTVNLNFWAEFMSGEDHPHTAQRICRSGVQKLGQDILVPCTIDAEHAYSVRIMYGS